MSDWARAWRTAGWLSSAQSRRGRKCSNSEPQRAQAVFDATILVSGASGQLGRQVIMQLVEANQVPPARIIAATRTPARLEDLAASSWLFRPTSSTWLAADGSSKHQAVVVAAIRVGARLVAYTSMLRPEPGIVAPGRWPTSVGEGRVACAARHDMAAAIARHLDSDGSQGAVLELTVSRPSAPPRSPEPMARLLASVDAHVRSGYADVVSDTLKSLSRREPLSLAEFLRARGGELTE